MVVPRLWEVVGGAEKGGILVRAGQSTSSAAYDRRLQCGALVRELETAADRLHYEKVSGQGPDRGWVTLRLGGKELLVLRERQLPEPEAPKTAATPPKAPTSTTVSDLLSQLEQELLSGIRPNKPTREAPAALAGRQDRVPPLELPARRLVPAETSAPADGRELDASITVSFTEEGGAPAPEGLQDWLRAARLWLQRFNPKAKVPSSVRLPSEAARWEPAAAVIYALTHGQFDPRRDLASSAGTARPSPGLVSVVCTTSDRRRSFHPLLYESFRLQKYEPRELIVVHTGEMPSEFFQECAREDSRVVYRFFPVTREAPGSPRLSDEKHGNPWAAVLNDDTVSELAMWEYGEDPWSYEIVRDGWTKGLKRNIAACIARGSAIAHCDDGCLYAPDYLSSMHAALVQQAGGAELPSPAAIALARWYTMSVKDQEFHLVDLKKKESMWEQFGKNPAAEQTVDQYNHGFAHMYTRSAWLQQPFKDVETVGTSDYGFIQALRKQSFAVGLASPPTAEGLAACGWHRDATCGSVEAAANVNYSQTLSFFSFRGEPIAKVPSVFKTLLPFVKEVATELSARRDRHLRDLVEDHGSVYVCAYCNFAVALAKNMQETKEVNVYMRVTDAVDMMQTHDRERMKFEAGCFSAAGGAVAEGEHTRVPAGATWLPGKIQRMAICRNCGWQLGWRYEPEANGPPWTAYNKLYMKTGERSQEELNKLVGPVSWSIIWRHVRERRRPGEHVPEDGDKEPPRHMETEHNRKRADVCPQGHKLHCFSTGQGNGGAMPLFYTCDVCDKDARWNQHLWGCGTCDYDICESCQFRRGGSRVKSLGM